MEDVKEILRKMEEEDGFFHQNHYHIVEATPNSVILKAELETTAMNPYGMAHGGFIYGLGDTVMGMLVAGLGQKGVTLNSTIQFLKPGRGKYLIAKGEIIKEGQNICFVRANIYNDENILIATMDSNYYNIK